MQYHYQLMQNVHSLICDNMTSGNWTTTSRLCASKQSIMSPSRYV